MFNKGDCVIILPEYAEYFSITKPVRILDIKKTHSLAETLHPQILTIHKPQYELEISGFYFDHLLAKQNENDYQMTIDPFDEEPIYTYKSMIVSFIKKYTKIVIRKCLSCASFLCIVKTR